MDRFDLLVWGNVFIIVVGLITNSWIIATTGTVMFMLTINLDHVAKHHKKKVIK